MNSEMPENDEYESDDENQSADVEQESGSESGSESQEPINPLALSDEEYLAMDDPTVSVGESPAAPEEDFSTGSASDDAPESHEPDSTDEERAPEADNSEAQADSGKESERDIAAEHARLFAPIKAGGQTLQLKNIDEAISLLQKGADYHRKTEELAKHRKTIKTLERAGIGADNLNYLIDLHNKNPQAITKLIADAGLDPLDLDTDSDDTKNYKPAEHTISDSDIEFEDTLENLKKTPTYPKLLDIVGKQWDVQSRESVVNDTELLNVINTHLANGIYDVISSETNRLKAIGQLEGLTDLAAYQQVGRAINERGGFTHLITDEQRAQMAQDGKDPTPVVTYRPGQGSGDPNLDAKRRAAAPTKAASRAPKKTSNQTNPLALSDEEFEKQFSSTL